MLIWMKLMKSKGSSMKKVKADFNYDDDNSTPNDDGTPAKIYLEISYNNQKQKK